MILSFSIQGLFKTIISKANNEPNKDCTDDFFKINLCVQDFFLKYFSTFANKRKNPVNVKFAAFFVASNLQLVFN